MRNTIFEIAKDKKSISVIDINENGEVHLRAFSRYDREEFLSLYSDKEHEEVEWCEKRPEPLFNLSESVEGFRSVTSAQAKIALSRAGLLKSIEQAITESDNDEVKIWWDYSPNFNRNSPALLAIAEMLKLTAEQVDGLFESAEKIM